MPFCMRASEMITRLVCTDECTVITNLVLCISVFNRRLVFSNLIHLPEDTLNGRVQIHNRKKKTSMD